MADLHANRPALEACLADARARGAERFGFLGDYVGYGADPEWVVDTVRAEVAAGGFALMGNHDQALALPGGTHAYEADQTLAWTRGRLDADARAFLAGLPTRVEGAGRLFVHATPEPTTKWPYLDGPEAACRALVRCEADSVFCGHVHIPALYGLDRTGRKLAFRPVPGVPVPIPRHRRWLAVLGSVGQPRDRNTAAAYALLDEAAEELTFLRVPYDHGRAARAILAAGLPPSLADRLAEGR
jgi:diadenosine tetraphosphatase ApaH/serine/threonine PP2A family protein phosphatase